MNRHSMYATGMVCVTIVASAAILSLAGPLNPPAGPVASSYKTLTEVEPRVAINATNTRGDADSLFKITQPGSYYLTGNITGVANKHGIEIEASDVTIDLMGFRVQGVATSLSGIFVTNVQLGLTVRNGCVTGWGGDGVNLFQNEGRGSLVEQVHATSNGGSGIKGGPNGVVRDCTASGNGGDGILAGQNSIAERCAARDNTAHGIQTGSAAVVTGCSARDNAGNGFFLAAGSRISNCAALSNDLDGIGGQWVTIEHCKSDQNVGHGIQVGSSSLVRENLCRSNGDGAPSAAGILVTGSDSTIDGNTVVLNDRGIHVTGTGNFVTRNAASGNTASNYDIVASNANARVLTPGAAFVSTDPWANFAY